MKTFLIISDTHGRQKYLEKLRPLIAENDYVVHLGDGAADMREIARQFPEKVYIVKGNNDFSYGAEEYIVEEEGLRMLFCHGHKHGVKSGLNRLAAYAKSKGCDVALYGHTHRAAIDTVDGVLCVNPGVGGGLDASYCYLALHKGKAVPTIVHFNETMR